jgi:hypothetical protein
VEGQEGGEVSELDEIKVQYESQILEGMARTLWVMAYANFIEGDPPGEQYEDLPRPGSGEDWDEVAPETPDAAMQAATALAELISSQEMSLPDLYDLAMTVHKGEPFEFTEEGLDSDHPHDAPSRFGSDLAMGALGSGVDWCDDHVCKRPNAVFEPKMPRFECYFDGNELVWSGSGEKGYAGGGRGKARQPRRTTSNNASVVSYLETASIDEETGDVDSDSELDDEWTVDEDTDEPYWLQAAEHIRDTSSGNVEPSSSAFHSNIWYTDTDPNVNYQTGEETRRSYHLRNFSEADERRIHDELTGRTVQGRRRYPGLLYLNEGDYDVFGPGRGNGGHTFVLRYGGFTEATATYLVVYAMGLEEAVDEMIDWLEDSHPEALQHVDEMIEEAYKEALEEGLDEDEAMQQAETDTTSGGNHGRHIMSEDWSIVAEDPDEADLEGISRRATRDNPRKAKGKLDKKAAHARDVLQTRKLAHMETCSPGCPGWAVFESGRGLGIQRCDECDSIAKEEGLPQLHDDEVKLLPEAQRALRQAMRGNPPGCCKPNWSRGGVQSLLFSVDKFTASQAKAWATKHGYKASKVDTTDHYHRLRQHDPKRGAPCRTITFGHGIKAVVCEEA